MVSLHLFSVALCLLSIASTWRCLLHICHGDTCSSLLPLPNSSLVICISTVRMWTTVQHPNLTCKCMFVFEDVRLSFGLVLLEFFNPLLTYWENKSSRFYSESWTCCLNSFSKYHILSPAALSLPVGKASLLIQRWDTHGWGWASCESHRWKLAFLSPF